MFDIVTPTVEGLNQDAREMAKLLLLAHLRAYGGAGSGNFGHAGRPGAVGGSGTSDVITKDIVAQQIKQIVDQQHYAHYGVRVDNNSSLVVGHVAPVSYDWSDEYHPMPLTGTSAIDVSDWKRVINYSGQDLILLGSNKRVRGTDRNEFIMTDAVVLAKWPTDNLWRTLGGSGSGNFGHAGRPGTVGGSTVGVKILGTPEATAAVHAHLDKLPPSLRSESVVKEIHAFDDPKIASAKIDDYLMKHYGFSASESAKGLVDRERGVMYTMTNPRETYTQFAHTLVDRIQSPTFQKVVRDSPLPIKKPEDAFSKYFADSFTNVASLGDPASAVYDLFKVWGWR